MSNRYSTSRRRFIQGIGLAAVPLITQSYRPFSDNFENKAQENHRILCCNIRVDLPEDDAKGFGWSSRKDSCFQIIKAHKPDIICLQEVLKNQMNDFKIAFPAFQALGFDGPEMDAHTTGYHGIAKNPIMYSTDRYELLAAGGFWLSETPLVAGSKSWDTNRARHVNWVRLKDKKSAKDFRVLNLHLDHKSQLAREHQTNLVLDESAQYPNSYPQLLCGDFNASAENKVYENVISAGWHDTYTAIHGNAEPGYTVHLFQGDKYEKKGQGKKIDFVFARGEVESIESDIIKDHVNGKYPSDHYFVSAEIKLT